MDIIHIFRLMEGFDDQEAGDFPHNEYNRNPWPWNENHEANEQAELEEVQFLP